MDIRKIDKLKAIATITAIAVAVSAIGGAIAYVYSQIRPKITVNDVDFNNGIANLSVKGKTKILYANSTLDCGNGWGVRFGTIFNKDGIPTINRLELVKNNNVVETLKTK